LTAKLRKQPRKSFIEKLENEVVTDPWVSQEVSATDAPIAEVGRGLTWEVGLYGLILMVALGLRLWALADYPLSNAEATQSLVAWQIYQGNVPSLEWLNNTLSNSGVSYSPLVGSIQVLTFFLANASDTTARLATVLLGSLLVLLPLTMRRQLGAKVCLLTSALLTISPTALYLSRTLNGEIGVAVGALMVIAGFFNWAADRPARWHYFLAIGLAVLFSSGAMAYSVIIVLGSLILLGLALFFKSSPDYAIQWLASLGEPTPEAESVEFSESDENEGEISLNKEEQAKPKINLAKKDKPAQTAVTLDAQWQQAGLLFLLVLVVLATTAALNFKGFSVLTNFPLDWVHAFRLKPLGEASFNGVFLLTMYELLTVVLGLAGLALAIFRNNLLYLAFGGWFVGLLLLDVLMGRRPAGTVILSLVPLTFLAAYLLAWLWDGLEVQGSWHNEGLLLAIGVVLAAFGYIGLTGWLTRACGADDRMCQYAWVQAVAAVVLFVIVAILFGLITESGVAWRGLALTCLGVGLLITLNNGARLNYGTLMNLGYQPLAGQPPSTELVSLMDTVKGLSIQRIDDIHLLDVTLVGTPSPSIQWQLHDYPNVIQMNSAPNPPTTTVLITSVTAQEQVANFGESYIGQSFGLDALWSPVGLPTKDLLKWFIYRRVDGRPQSNKVVLWLKTE